MTTQIDVLNATIAQNNTQKALNIARTTAQNVQLDKNNSDLAAKILILQNENT